MNQWPTTWSETTGPSHGRTANGSHPANVTHRFTELCEEISLPPIRLHDLRHEAATLAPAAGGDLKDIEEMLGHSSIAITADPHTSLPPDKGVAVTETAARLVPRGRTTRATGTSLLVASADAPSAHANAPGRTSRGRRCSPDAPEVIRGEAESPLSGSNRRPPLYKSGALAS